MSRVSIARCSDPHTWSYNYPTNYPIAVDLDGTLFPYNLLWTQRPPFKTTLSSALQAIRTPHPWACFKHRIAASSWTAPHHPWPLHTPLMALLTAWKHQGCRLILVTGAPQAIALTISQELALFDDVWHSTPTLNLVGHHKANALTSSFGHKGFTYAGDSWQDPPVWQASRDVLVIAPPTHRLVNHMLALIHKDQRIAVMPHPHSKR